MFDIDDSVATHPNLPLIDDQSNHRPAGNYLAGKIELIPIVAKVQFSASASTYVRVPLMRALSSSGVP